MSALPLTERPPLVLVVDDHAEMREVFAEILRVQGFRVETAISGLDGVAKATITAPNLIIMDLAMPDMDGWEATRQLKASPGTKDVPILVLSAHGLDQYREAAAAAGCSAYLTKPLDPADLVREVRRLLAC